MPAECLEALIVIVIIERDSFKQSKQHTTQMARSSRQFARIA